MAAPALAHKDLTKLQNVVANPGKYERYSPQTGHLDEFLRNLHCHEIGDLVIITTPKVASTHWSTVMEHFDGNIFPEEKLTDLSKEIIIMIRDPLKRYVSGQVMELTFMFHGHHPERNLTKNLWEHAKNIRIGTLYDFWRRLQCGHYLENDILDFSDDITKHGVQYINDIYQPMFSKTYIFNKGHTTFNLFYKWNKYKDVDTVRYLDIEDLDSMKPYFENKLPGYTELVSQRYNAVPHIAEQLLVLKELSQFQGIRFLDDLDIHTNQLIDIERCVYNEIKISDKMVRVE